MNGAVIAGVFDLTIGLVGHSCAIGRRAGTAQLNIHFVRPVLGDRFDVLGDWSEPDARWYSQRRIFPMKVESSAPVVMALSL